MAPPTGGGGHIGGTPSGRQVVSKLGTMMDESKGLLTGEVVASDEGGNEHGADGAARALSSIQGAIPSHVWQLLQQAGEEAAQRLNELLSSPSFHKQKTSDQVRLIELALVRAYGLPVRRQISVELSSKDGDAIAASLSSLADRLPERNAARERRQGRRRRSSPPEGGDTGE